MAGKLKAAGGEVGEDRRAVEVNREAAAGVVADLDGDFSPKLYGLVGLKAACKNHTWMPFAPCPADLGSVLQRC